MLFIATCGSWVKTLTWNTPGPVGMAHVLGSVPFLCTPLIWRRFVPSPGTPRVVDGCHATLDCPMMPNADFLPDSSKMSP
eukprot:5547172-Pyramimonas_sp.AAC.1